MLKQFLIWISNLAKSNKMKAKFAWKRQENASPCNFEKTGLENSLSESSKLALFCDLQSFNLATV